MSTTLILVLRTCPVPSENQTRQTLFWSSVAYMISLIYDNWWLRFSIHSQSVVVEVTTLGPTDLDSQLKARTATRHKLTSPVQHFVLGKLVDCKEDHLLVTSNTAGRASLVPECLGHKTDGPSQDTDVTSKTPGTYLWRKITELQPLTCTSEHRKRKGNKVQSLLDVNLLCTVEESPLIEDFFSSSMYGTRRGKCYLVKGSQKEGKVDSFHHAFEAMPLVRSGCISHFLRSQIAPTKSFPVDCVVKTGAVAERGDIVKESAIHHLHKNEVRARENVEQNNEDISDVDLVDHLDAISSLDSSPNPMEWLASIDQVDRQSKNIQLLDLQHSHSTSAACLRPAEKVNRFQGHNENLLKSLGQCSSEATLPDPEEKFSCHILDLIQRPTFEETEALPQESTAARTTCVSNIAYAAIRDSYINFCPAPPFQQNKVNSGAKSVVHEDVKGRNPLKTKRKHKAKIRKELYLSLRGGRLQDVRVVISEPSKISSLKIVGCFYCCKGNHDMTLSSDQETAKGLVSALKEEKQIGLSDITEKGYVSPGFMERKGGANRDQSCHRTTKNFKSSSFIAPYLDVSVSPEDHPPASCVGPSEVQSKHIQEAIVSNVISGKIKYEDKLVLSAAHSSINPLSQKQYSLANKGAGKLSSFIDTCKDVSSKDIHVHVSRCKQGSSLALVPKTLQVKLTNAPSTYQTEAHKTRHQPLSQSLSQLDKVSPPKDVETAVSLSFTSAEASASSLVACKEKLDRVPMTAELKTAVVKICDVAARIPRLRHKVVTNCSKLVTDSDVVSVSGETGTETVTRCRSGNESSSSEPPSVYRTGMAGIMDVKNIRHGLIAPKDTAPVRDGTTLWMGLPGVGVTDRVLCESAITEGDVIVTNLRRDENEHFRPYSDPSFQRESDKREDILAAKSFAFTRTARKQTRSSVVTRSRGEGPLTSKTQSDSPTVSKTIPLTYVGCRGTASQKHPDTGNESHNMHGPLNRARKSVKRAEVSSSERICAEKPELNSNIQLVGEGRTDSLSADLPPLSVQIINAGDRTCQRLVFLGVKNSLEGSSNAAASQQARSFLPQGSQHGLEHRSKESAPFRDDFSSWLQKCSSWLLEVKGPELPNVSNNDPSFNLQPKGSSRAADPCWIAETSELVGLSTVLSNGPLQSTIAGKASPPNTRQFPWSQAVSDGTSRRDGQSNAVLSQDQLASSGRVEESSESIKSASQERTLPEWKCPRAVLGVAMSSKFSQDIRPCEAYDSNCDPESLPLLSIEITNAGNSTPVNSRIVRLKHRAGCLMSSSGFSLQDDVEDPIKVLASTGEQDSEETATADEENDPTNGTARAANGGKEKEETRSGLSSVLCRWQDLSERSLHISHTSPRPRQPRARMFVGGKGNQVSLVPLPSPRVDSENEIENGKCGKRRSQSPIQDVDSLVSFTVSEAESSSNVAIGQCNQNSKGEDCGSHLSASNRELRTESLQMMLSPAHLSERDDLFMGIVDEQDYCESQPRAFAFLEAEAGVKSSRGFLCFPSVEVPHRTLSSEVHEECMETPLDIQSFTQCCGPASEREERAHSSSDTMDAASNSARWCKVVVSDIAKDPRYKELFSKRRVRAPANFQVEWLQKRGRKRITPRRKEFEENRRNKKARTCDKPNAVRRHASSRRMHITASGASYIASLMLKQQHYPKRISPFGVMESSLQQINHVFCRERSFWASLDG